MKAKRLSGVKRVTYYKLCLFDSDEGFEDAFSEGETVIITYKDGSEICGTIYMLCDFCLELETGEETIDVYYIDIDNIKLI